MPAAVNNTLTAERVTALKTYEAAKLSTEELLSLTARPRIDFSSILQTVSYAYGAQYSSETPQELLHNPVYL